jgi:hypothetical protein
MTTLPDEGINVDLAESPRRRAQDRVACFLHLRDLIYTHPQVAAADVVAFLQTLEATVIAEKAAHEKRLAAARERARGEADR